MSLTEFLLARIAEDEAAARDATPGPWRDLPMGSEGSIVLAGGNTITTARKPATCREFADADHIARFDPARVLAECAAKRQIVEDLGPLVDYDRDMFIVQLSVESVARRTLATLAAFHADHPDYREEWKP